MNSKIETCFMVITKQTKIIPYASICFVSRTGLLGVAIDRLLKICIHKIKLMNSERMKRAELD